MIEEHVHFYANNLRLEGVLTYHEDATSSPVILLCAPHPTLGGNMDNNVITSMAKVSADRDFISLRFNFHGVGNSEGHTQDIAEKFKYWEETLSSENYADAVISTQAALDFLTSHVDVSNGIFIAGYSFGAIIGMRVGVESSRVVAFASISTPFCQYNLDFLQRCKKEKLFLYSQNDFASTVENTLEGFKKLLPPKTLELIRDSDHFYRGQEDMISQKVCNFFQRVYKNEIEKR